MRRPFKNLTELEKFIKNLAKGGVMIGYLVFTLILVVVVILFLRWLEKPETKKDEKNENYVKICPKCGDADVIVDFSNPVVWDYGTPPKYKCKECGFISNVFPEVDHKKIKNFKKELKDAKHKGNIEVPKSELIDTSTGYSVGIFEIILSVVGLILIPILLFLDGFDPTLLFLLFWSLFIIYAVWRIHKKKKSIN